MDRPENRRDAELDAEKSVLGSILIDGPMIAEILEHVSAEDFSTPSHISIFRAMADCYSHGIRPDSVSVAAAMFGDVNPVLLVELVTATPNSLQAVQYARLVAEASRRRQIAETSARIGEAARGGAGADELDHRLTALQAIAIRPSAVDVVPAWHTLAEIPDEAPEPLLFGMCEPHGPTLPYAAPGVGKGMTGAYLVREAQRLGMRPAIFDAEQRPREWARRCSGLGVDRAEVAYITPHDLGPSNAGRPLWESAPVLGAILRAAGVDILIVDSILPACAVGEERLRADAAVPFMFVAALDALGLPSVSFGHTPKGSPEGDPFGSFAWVASSRLTWLGTRSE
ncbi:MAG TPA: DnaB-like helicase N-terminal domain-containing protein, partial [Candidatus Limnocylindrales bacterium]